MCAGQGSEQVRAVWSKGQCSGQASAQGRALSRAEQ
jgi:hypothetical protein